jgi:hydrogenase-4 component B
MTLFAIGLGAIVAGGVSAAMTRRARGTTGDLLYQLLVVSGCAIAAADAARVLVSRTALSLSVRSTVPGGDWIVGIDALSAVFLLAVLGVGAICALFGTQDLARARAAHPERAHRSTWPAQLAFALLITAIALVVTAGSVVVFLGAWEVMAISSYVLIVTHHEEEDVRRAGLIYLVATHTATLALFVMFAAWQSGATDWSFEALAAASPSLGTGATAAIILLALVGFGFKAGVVPLHFWLPPAHAAAPSHVSALMSGIVIKTGIYGVLRVLLLLGDVPSWCGWLILGLGVASGVLGVLWALAQHDTKRLLAFHSVENIGIILMGIGVGVIGLARDAPGLATLGFAAALLHTVNHAVFKSLLFLGAGAVYRATGTRNMEELGGLARRMPWTWLGFLVGAAAIVGLPPLNGFVSEWLVYQGLFLAGEPVATPRLALLGIPMLALIGALALACFAKVAGVVFLGTPRTLHAASAMEGRLGSHAPMLLLAAACVVLGVVPTLGIALVEDAAQQMAGANAAPISAAVISGARTISMMTVSLVVVGGVFWWIRSLLVRERSVRREATWGCGYAEATPRMQYTASSFASPLLSVFGALSGVHVERTSTSLHTHPKDLVLDGVARPLWDRLRHAALRLRGIQQGRLHLYLLYVMAALLVLLAYLALFPRAR